MFQRLKIILLLLISLSSFSAIAQVQLNDGQNLKQAEISNFVQSDFKKQVSDLNSQYSNKLDLFSKASVSEGQDYIQALLKSQPQKKQASPEQEQPLISELASVNFFNEVRRVVSSDNRAGVGAKPNYFLQIAFFEPAIFNRFIPPVEKPKFASHWTSQLSSTVSRLSGWKDGNSLYTHNHIRFS